MNKIKSTIYEYFEPIIVTFNWFKKLIYIVNNYDNDLSILSNRIHTCSLEIQEGVQLIKDRTNIHADIHLQYNHPSEIIVIGRYRNRDYIQTYSVDNDDIEGLIDQLKRMEKYGVVQKIDAPIGIKAIIEQDLKYWRE